MKGSFSKRWKRKNLYQCWKSVKKICDSYDRKQFENLSNYNTFILNCTFINNCFISWYISLIKFGTEPDWNKKIVFYQTPNDWGCLEKGITFHNIFKKFYLKKV